MFRKLQNVTYFFYQYPANTKADELLFNENEINKALYWK